MKKSFFILLIYILSFQNAYSLIKVDITRGNLDPLPIAVSPLHVDVKSENIKSLNIKSIGDDISKIIDCEIAFPPAVKPIEIGTVFYSPCVFLIAGA